MKKTVRAILVLLIIAAIPIFACAAEEDASIIAAFIQENTLYTYTALPDETDFTAVSAIAIVDDEIIFAEKNSGVAEQIPATSYLVLLDVSGSMEKYNDSVQLFLESFQAEAKGKLTFALATVGNEYLFIGEYANTEELSEAISGIDYDAGYTCVYDSLNAALDYYNQKPRMAGQLFGVILISDGDDNRSTAKANDVREKIADTAPVMIHSVMVNANNENAEIMREFSDLTGGLCGELTAEESGAEEFAANVARYVNGFYSARFALPAIGAETAAETDITLNLLINGQTAYTFDVSAAPVLESAAFIASDTDIPKPADTPKPPKTPKPSDSPEPEPEQQEPKSESEAEPERELKDGEARFPIVIIIAIAAVVVIAALIVLLAVKKKKPKAEADDGILLVFDIQSGSHAGERIEKLLTDELFIGKNRNSAIVLRDNGVSPKNTRIFLQDNLIYVEDLSSENGTSIGGMKIYAPNKLQSGAELTVGFTRIIVRF